MPVEEAGRQDLLGIGEFASLTGLTVSTLRHYHHAGLLIPEQIDGWTGYRRYGSHQVHRARIIRAMRYLQMPLEDIGACFGPIELKPGRSGLTHRLRLE